MSKFRDFSRRRFLHATASTGVAATFGTFLNRTAHGMNSCRTVGYGGLRPTADEATGLDLLCLPEGFRYRSYGWTGDRMTDGTVTPGIHDGMGVIGNQNGVLTLVRNHELVRRGGAFGTDDNTYDPFAGGGCATLTFDSHTGDWLSSRPSIAGTVKNCAGGPTPWGTWLSCEESVLGPNSSDEDGPLGFREDHGWIFEVTSDPTVKPKPLKDMGRFVHEATAVDPATGFVYETEDRYTAGFYRFLPNSRARLADGGELQMLKVDGRDDLRKGVDVGETLDVTWVTIDDVERAHSPGSVSESAPEGDTLGVFTQGKAQEAATFGRLEGCWYGNGFIYLVATNGGNNELGQVWEFSPSEQQLRLIFESPSADILDSPDNITVSPRGGLILCEDGDTLPQRIHGMTVDGQLFPFASNNVVLSGERNGLRGDFRREEWAGATFSPDGRWLFVNIQTPGITFAITGPWSSGLI